MTTFIADGLFYLSVGVLAALALLAWWWLLVRTASHAWHAGRAASKHRRNRSTPPPMPPVNVAGATPTLSFSAVQEGPWSDRPKTSQPGPEIAPPAGGVCSFGHYVESRYRACSLGHKFNGAMTRTVPAHTIEAARITALKAAREATEQPTATWA